MSKRSRKNRKARPCYTCGYVARHFGKTGDRCVCQACKTMPQAWRDELRKVWERRVADRAWHNSRPYFAPEHGPIEPATLDAYAWPGGYPIVYYIDGDTVCPSCIMSVLREDYFTGREQILSDVYYEGPVENCSECDCEIESAYGDPDA